MGEDVSCLIFHNQREGILKEGGMDEKATYDSSYSRSAMFYI